LSNEAVP
jgi:hypothetical protein